MTQEIKTVAGSYNELSLYFKDADINHRYLHSCVVALENNEVAGKLCIYLNPYLQYNGQPALQFGNFMSTESDAVFEQLLSHAVAVAGSQSIHYIIGPINGSTWDEYRLPLSDTAHPFMGDLSYPAYYKQLFTNNGFQLLHRYYTAVAPLNEDILEGTQPITNGVRIRQIDMDIYQDELKLIYPLCMAAFKDNVLYSGISEQDFIDYYLPFASFIDARYLLMAEDMEGVAGFVFGYPDIQYKNSKQLILKTIARHPARTYPGLVDGMIRTLYQRAYANGFKTMVHAFMHSDNRSYILSPAYGGTVCREYGLFIKQIDG